jgi:GNAT superfamily N-acetyltransferase
MASVTIRPVESSDDVALEEIRRAAFAPVFASFRAILGDEIYELAQAREDRGQADLLRSMMTPDSVWEVFVAEVDAQPVGFVSVRIEVDARLGEIGLNAVHPEHAGHGVGTAMYEHALDHMRRAGVRVATVGTGGDASHAPARRAYEKVGFDVAIPSVWMCRLL